jgi:predicted transcriptional regulator
MCGLETAKKLEPAVPVKDSVTPDMLICLCCGKQFRVLKRHLRTQHGLTFDEYRAAFGLNVDYPEVALNCSIQRSNLAKVSHLRHKPENRKLSRKAVKIDP